MDRANVTNITQVYSVFFKVICSKGLNNLNKLWWTYLLYLSKKKKINPQKQQTEKANNQLAKVVEELSAEKAGTLITSGCIVVSGNVPLGPQGCQVGPQSVWFALLHPADAWSVWDLRTFESTPWALLLCSLSWLWPAFVVWAANLMLLQEAGWCYLELSLIFNKVECVRQTSTWLPAGQCIVMRGSASPVNGLDVCARLICVFLSAAEGRRGEKTDQNKVRL